MAKSKSTTSSRGATRAGAVHEAAPKGHRLNVPMKDSEMSAADKLTLRAWKTTYRNHAKENDK